RALAAGAVGAGEDDDGPLALGGFSFAGDGGGSPHWRGFEPASLVVPELALRRRSRGGERSVSLTLSTLACPDDVPGQLLARLQRRLDELHAAPLPLLDPAPTGRFEIAGAMPPEHYEQAVARAVEM